MDGLTGSAQASITTGSFNFDEATITDLIKKWMTLGDSYDASLRDNVPLMTAVEGAGLDYASKSHAGAANKAGEAYSTYLTECKNYCVNQAQLFQNALDDYLGMEHRNVTEIYKTETPPSNSPEHGPKPGI